jgi:hypothetical protein
MRKLTLTIEGQTDADISKQLQVVAARARQALRKGMLIQNMVDEVENGSHPTITNMVVTGDIVLSVPVQYQVVGIGFDDKYTMYPLSTWKTKLSEIKKKRDQILSLGNNAAYMKVVIVDKDMKVVSDVYLVR